MLAHGCLLPTPAIPQGAVPPRGTSLHLPPPRHLAPEWLSGSLGQAALSWALQEMAPHPPPLSKQKPSKEDQGLANLIPQADHRHAEGVVLCPGSPTTLAWKELGPVNSFDLLPWGTGQLRIELSASPVLPRPLQAPPGAGHGVSCHFYPTCVCPPSPRGPCPLLAGTPPPQIRKG